MARRVCLTCHRASAYILAGSGTVAMAESERISALTNDALATYLHQMVGIEFPPDQVERLRPLVELQAERLRQLESLDLGADDPRTMSYILDLRLSR